MNMTQELAMSILTEKLPFHIEGQAYPTRSAVLTKEEADVLREVAYSPKYAHIFKGQKALVYRGHVYAIGQDVRWPFQEQPTATLQYVHECQWEYFNLPKEEVKRCQRG